MQRTCKVINIQLNKSIQRRIYPVIYLDKLFSEGRLPLKKKDLEHYHKSLALSHLIGIKNTNLPGIVTERIPYFDSSVTPYKKGFELIINASRYVQTLLKVNATAVSYYPLIYILNIAQKTETKGANVSK